MTTDLAATLHAQLLEYAACLDDDRLEAWPGFFTEDARYRVTSADNYARQMPIGLIYADSRAMLTDRVSALREANIYEGQSYRHILSGTRVLDVSEGADCVRTETSFLVTRIMRDGATTLFASGRYLDTAQFSASGWRYREKIVVLDSSRIDTLLAIPL